MLQPHPHFPGQFFRHNASRKVPQQAAHTNLGGIWCEKKMGKVIQTGSQ